MPTPPIGREHILAWLHEENPERLEALWRLADQRRRECVGDEVHLRGLIEFSNVCGRQCAYCGLRQPNTKLRRYRMTADDVMASVREAERNGFGAVVLQSGEDPELDPSWLAGLVRRIRRETKLAITLSVGERAPEELRLWREAGADRYLLRFETSNPKLFASIHPGSVFSRLDLLRELGRLGYEVGSGVMIGIPGQSVDDLAGDILLFETLNLDMIGVGPFIPHPDTPFGRLDPKRWLDRPGQTPNSELMTYKVLALTRLVCPYANIPSTTALATLNPSQGHRLALSRGANVVMPNVTPARFREQYAIYPDKACIDVGADGALTDLASHLAAIGRTAGKGRGDSPNKGRRATDWTKRR